MLQLCSRCNSRSGAGVTNILEISKDPSPPRGGGGGFSVDFAKVKSDLVSPNVHFQTRGLLLQALRWVGVLLI